MTVLASEGGGALDGAVRAVMIEAAHRAIMPRYRRLSVDEVREKSPEEIVTIADRESEEILSEGLARILPQAMIVGEEAADTDPALVGHLGSRLCWIVDPLDGTANFVAGEGPFGVLVALAEHGVPIGGWILDPQSDRFVAGQRDRGTFVDGHRACSRSTGAGTPIAAISSLFAKAPGRAVLFDEVQSRYETVPIPRCAAEIYPAMISGKSDIALFERTLPWDHAAGVLCLTEAGGIATRLDGSAYRIDDQTTGLVAAATPALWTQFREYHDGVFSASVG